MLSVDRRLYVGRFRPATGIDFQPQNHSQPTEDLDGGPPQVVGRITSTTQRRSPSTSVASGARTRRQPLAVCHSKRMALRWCAISISRDARARDTPRHGSPEPSASPNVMSVLAHLPTERHILGEHEVALVEAPDLFEWSRRARKKAPETQSTEPSFRGER